MSTHCAIGHHFCQLSSLLNQWPWWWWLMKWWPYPVSVVVMHDFKTRELWDDDHHLPAACSQSQRASAYCVVRWWMPHSSTSSGVVAWQRRHGERWLAPPTLLTGSSGLGKSLTPAAITEGKLIHVNAMKLIHPAVSCKKNILKTLRLFLISSLFFSRPLRHTHAHIIPTCRNGDRLVPLFFFAAVFRRQFHRFSWQKVCCGFLHVRWWARAFFPICGKIFARLRLPRSGLVPFSLCMFFFFVDEGANTKGVKNKKYKCKKKIVRLPYANRCEILTLAENQSLAIVVRIEVLSLCEKSNG